MSLHDMEDRPWADWNRGREITLNQIARHLKPFGIKPKKMRIYNANVRGYDQQQFNDAFTRYLDGTTEQTSKINVLEKTGNGTVPPHVPPQNQANTLETNNCSTVPLKWGTAPPGLFDDDEGEDKYNGMFDD